MHQAPWLPRGIALATLEISLPAPKESRNRVPPEGDRLASCAERGVSMRPTGFILFALGFLLVPSPGWCQLIPGTMEVHWSAGAPDCAKNPDPPLQVHQYNAQTFVLRENLCATFEGPFLYLLIGSTKALLIDTGDIEDPKVVPLANTVMGLIPGEGAAKLPLLVVHTHRHLDHRAGDGQFRNLPRVQIIGYDVDSVVRFYNFAHAPNGLAQVDLGDRTLDVIPSPGHSETEVSFYDRNTGLLFSGDFLMPARLLIDDAGAYLASAERVAVFARDRPITYVLGGHIEVDSTGGTFRWESRYHPHEHALQMTKSDLVALPSAIRDFNGFYTVRGNFIMENSWHLLMATALFLVIVLGALAWIVIGYFRRRGLARRLRPAI